MMWVTYSSVKYSSNRPNDKRYNVSIHQAPAGESLGGVAVDRVNFQLLTQYKHSWQSFYGAPSV